MKTTGEKLRKYLKTRGTKQAWIAELLEISRQGLSYKLRGDSPITLENAVAIRKACRMSEDEFLDIFGDESWFGLVES